MDNQQVTTPAAAMSSTSGSFADSAGRQFVVARDERSRVISVTGSRERTIFDVRRVGYDSAGRIQGALLGSGHALYFSYTPDGRQIVRDQFGNALERTRNAVGVYEVTKSADPQGWLASALGQLEGLFSKLQTGPSVQPKDVALNQQ